MRTLSDKRVALARKLIQVRAVNLAVPYKPFVFSYVEMPDKARVWLEGYLNTKISRNFNSLDELSKERKRLQTLLTQKQKVCCA